MHEVNLFGIFIDILNKTKIHYFVTGSVAAIVYKEELQWWALNNIREIEMSGMVIRVAPPEYVILKK